MMKLRLSAGVLVEHDGRILMVRSVRPGRYDFWVAPGGGVEGLESLEAAACREAFEETGLAVATQRLVYIEELADATTRYCKFWHLARLAQPAPEPPPLSALAQQEGIVDVAWLTQAELVHMQATTQVFPALLQGRFWTDRAAGFPGVVHLPLQRMTAC
jgi:8-oxo-dGTP diphosphatase